MSKYVEAPKKDVALEKARKRILFLLLLCICSVCAGFVCTGLVFVSAYFAFGALVFEALSPVFALLAVQTGVRYRNGGKYKKA